MAGSRGGPLVERARYGGRSKRSFGPRISTEATRLSLPGGAPVLPGPGPPGGGLERRKKNDPERLTWGLDVLAYSVRRRTREIARDGGKVDVLFDNRRSGRKSIGR